MKTITKTLLVLFVILSSVTIIFLLPSCDDNPTDPEPGRRDYVWTIDTLDINYTYINKAWGASNDDVWAVCYSGIWHYDGEEWTTDGISRPISPHAIWGFASTEVYIGGQGGKIWRYNGEEWKSFAQLEKEGTDFIDFQDIWGESSRDFYAVGAGPDKELYANHTVMTHYTDGKWKIINTNELKGIVLNLRVNKLDRKIYLSLSKIGGIVHPDSTIIYEYKNDSFIKIYSSEETIAKQADIQMIGDEVYFILGNRIAKRKNNKFSTILNVDNPNFYQRIWGRNEKDIFLFMLDGMAHYDGNNIEYLFHFNISPQTQVYGAAIFENEVFFTAYEAPTGKNFVYHGKLIE